MASIIDRLNHWVDQKPDKLLFAFLDIDGNIVEQYTYGTFSRRVEAIASNLQHSCQFRKNGRVLLAYPPGVEMLCAFFACARIGLIPVPVYPPASHGFQAALYKITYIAKDCQAVAVLTSREYYWSFKLNAARNQLSSFSFKKEYLSGLKWIDTTDFKRPHKNEIQEGHSDILFLQYTSGSTSQPKGVMVTHDNILHNCEIALDFAPVGVSWLPQYHDMGLIGYYLFIAMKGGATYGFSPMDFIRRPALWLETISRYRGTASSAPNFAFEFCLRPEKIPEGAYKNLDLSSLRFLMAAAEPVNPDIYHRFLEKFRPFGLKPRNFYTAFGLAEFTLAVSTCGRRAVEADKHSLKMNRLKVIERPDNHPSNSIARIMSCGKPLGDTIVKIVDEEKHLILPEGSIGEIWVNGKSKCPGYWNKPALTKKTFQASAVNSNHEGNSYLRTGDIGFMLEGELFVCGRSKDMIIIRGLNYYPQDIEGIVEAASKDIRKGCTAAFSVEIGGEEKLVVVAELKSAKVIPNPAEILANVRKLLNVEVYEAVFIPPRTIPKTSSGKIARHRSRQAWLENGLKALARFSGHAGAPQLAGNNNGRLPFDELKSRYGLTGNELQSLSEIGMGSLDMAILLNDIQKLLKKHGAATLARQIDFRMLQEISISELFELAGQSGNSSAKAISSFQSKLARLQKEHRAREQRKMLEDINWAYEPETPPVSWLPRGGGHILLTGGTGFFGPFLLKSLLEQTKENIYVLVRAKNAAHGKQRLRQALESVGSISPALTGAFEKRVVPVCGDLGKAKLGLDEATWRFLAHRIESIYNNGAIVNYLFNYDKMREVNIEGTNELLRFAFEGNPKVFNHISTTFIFGWAVKDILFETDSNQDLDLLDFGYSQTKWVSEQIVEKAMKRGLDARIFRPALISPSVAGGGNNFDIAIRLFAFMINHGIGVNALNQVSLLPADVAANNIVAISGLEDSVNQTFHVTRDQYANMMDITRIITALIGRQFELCSIPDFVLTMIGRCTKNDLLFPLLDFFVHSMDNIASMEFKRYDSTTYQAYRNKSRFGRPDPSLEETVQGMLLFMGKNEIIEYQAFHAGQKINRAAV